MKTTLFLATLSLAVCAASASAQTAAPAPVAPMRGDFATHKTAILAHLDRHIAAMTSMRGCVANANAREDVKQCRRQSRDAMRSQRAPA